MDTLSPLKMPKVSVTGPTGARDNIERLASVLQAFMPVNIVVRIEVDHNIECPSIGRLDDAMQHCTCDSVDVELSRFKDRRAKRR